MDTQMNAQERGGEGEGHCHEDGKEQENGQVVADFAAPGAGMADLPGLIEGLLHVGHDEGQVTQQDHHPEDPQGGHPGMFDVIEDLVDEIFGAGGQVLQKIGGQKARHADGLEDGEEQGEQGNKTQNSGVGQGRGAHQRLVPEEAANPQDQDAEELASQENSRPVAFVLPETAPEKISNSAQ